MLVAPAGQVGSGAKLAKLAVGARIGRIVPYSVGEMLTKGLGGELQAHHILEGRHLRNWGYTAEQIENAPSIVLTRAEHTAITNLLQESLKRGRTYTKEEVWRNYQVAYRDHPDWLKAIEGYFR